MAKRLKAKGGPKRVKLTLSVTDARLGQAGDHDQEDDHADPLDAA